MRLGCHVYDGDAPRLGPDAKPVYRICLVPTSELQVLDTWTTTGMRGTGSHDYTVTDVFIPDDRVHPATERSAFRPQPLYQSPAGPTWRTPPSAWPSRAWPSRSSRALAAEKQATWLPAEGRLAGRTTVQAKVAEAEALVGAGRAYAREATGDTWDTVCRGERPSPRQRAVYRLSIAHAMDNALRAIDLMYRLG